MTVSSTVRSPKLSELVPAGTLRRLSINGTDTAVVTGGHVDLRPKNGERVVDIHPFLGIKQVSAGLPELGCRFQVEGNKGRLVNLQNGRGLLEIDYNNCREVGHSGRLANVRIEDMLCCRSTNNEVMDNRLEGVLKVRIGRRERYTIASAADSNHGVYFDFPGHMGKEIFVVVGSEEVMFYEEEKLLASCSRFALRAALTNYFLSAALRIEDHAGIKIPVSCGRYVKYPGTDITIYLPESMVKFDGLSYHQRVFHALEVIEREAPEYFAVIKKEVRSIVQYVGTEKKLAGQVVDDDRVIYLNCDNERMEFIASVLVHEAFHIRYFNAKDAPNHQKGNVNVYIGRKLLYWRRESADIGTLLSECESYIEDMIFGLKTFGQFRCFEYLMMADRLLKLLNKKKDRLTPAGRRFLEHLEERMRLLIKMIAPDLNKLFNEMSTSKKERDAVREIVRRRMDPK